jgi:hypothetical protein
LCAFVYRRLEAPASRDEVNQSINGIYCNGC